jgi:hypothetical protein
MMIHKKVLADLPMVYAVTIIQVDGKSFYMAASEAKDGKCYLIDAQTYETHLAWNSPGGVMSLVSIEEENGAFLAIEKFFPVFLSEKACITQGRLQFINGTLTCTREKVCDLPFVHRIGLIRNGDAKTLVASTLCGGKAFTEDWSIPGGIYIGAYQSGSQTLLTQVQDGLTKDHGLFIKKENGKDVVLFASHEGVFHLMQKDGQWKVEKYLNDESSDIFLEDIDEDGVDELMDIQGFHGDQLVIYKRLNGVYRLVESIPIAFGHVLWAGKLCGHMGIIVGNRGGEKELNIYWRTSDIGEKVEFEKQVVDKDVGPAQIVVRHYRCGDDILSANHGIGQLALYQLRME